MDYKQILARIKEIEREIEENNKIIALGNEYITVMKTHDETKKIIEENYNGRT